LKEKGVETLIHYPIPIHRQEALKELKVPRGALPVTEKVAREILSLPFYPELTEGEAKEVGQHMEQFFVKTPKTNGTNNSE
jgi:dTDP-4-amino-4,6-dideoxygalactose transaminase